MLNYELQPSTEIWQLRANGREVDLFSTKEKAQAALEDNFKNISVNGGIRPAEKDDMHFTFIFGWAEVVCHWDIVPVKLY